MQNPSSLIPQHRTVSESDVFPVVAPVVVGYDFDDKEEDASSENCVAKYIVEPGIGVPVYFVKVSTMGSGAPRRFYNPQSPLFEVSARRNLAAALGKAMFEFKKVSPQQFELYRMFLRTKNQSYCRQAERLS